MKLIFYHIYDTRRLHSSRMRTTRLLPVSPSIHCSRGEGVSAPVFKIFPDFPDRWEPGPWEHILCYILYTLHRDRERNQGRAQGVKGSKPISPPGPLPGHRFLLFPVPFPALQCVQYSPFPVLVQFLSRSRSRAVCMIHKSHGRID